MPYHTSDPTVGDLEVNIKIVTITFRLALIKISKGSNAIKWLIIEKTIDCEIILNG